MPAVHVPGDARRGRGHQEYGQRDPRVFIIDSEGEIVDTSSARLPPTSSPPDRQPLRLDVPLVPADRSALRRPEPRLPPVPTDGTPLRTLRRTGRQGFGQGGAWGGIEHRSMACAEPADASRGGADPGAGRRRWGCAGCGGRETRSQSPPPSCGRHQDDGRAALSHRASTSRRRGRRGGPPADRAPG